MSGTFSKKHVIAGNCILRSCMHFLYFCNLSPPCSYPFLFHPPDCLHGSPSCTSFRPFSCPQFFFLSSVSSPNAGTPDTDFVPVCVFWVVKTFFSKSLSSTSLYTYSRLILYVSFGKFQNRLGCLSVVVSL